MIESIFELFLLLPLAVLVAVVLAMAGFAMFGAWGGGAGAIVGLAIGFGLDLWVGARVDAVTWRRRWAGTLLACAGLLAIALVAIYTR